MEMNQLNEKPLASSDMDHGQFFHWTTTFKKGSPALGLEGVSLCVVVEFDSKKVLLGYQSGGVHTPRVEYGLEDWFYADALVRSALYASCRDAGDTDYQMKYSDEIDRQRLLFGRIAEIEKILQQPGPVSDDRKAQIRQMASPPVLE